MQAGENTIRNRQGKTMTKTMKTSAYIANCSLFYYFRILWDSNILKHIPYLFIVPIITLQKGTHMTDINKLYGSI